MNVVYKEYLTGRDLQAIEATLFEGMEIDSAGKPTGFSPLAVQKRLNKAIELAVVSVNGETENVVEKVLDLPSHEYTEVKNKVSEMAELDEKKNQV